MNGAYGCQYCGGLLMRLDSLPSFTYCTVCKKQQEPVTPPEAMRPPFDRATHEPLKDDDDVA
jgi:hypothetical protein